MIVIDLLWDTIGGGEAGGCGPLVGDLPTPEARHRRWAHADVSVTGATSAAIVSVVRFRQLTGGTLCQVSYSWPEEVTENVA